jgi:hypothetical protein
MTTQAQDFTGNLSKPKSFWGRPEGKTGLLFMLAILAGAGYVLVKFLPQILAFASSLLGLVVTLLVLGALIYMVLDPKMRTLVNYMYKSAMRKITGVFITIDPIGILKNYIEDLQDNLTKMGEQIGLLRGQIRKLKTIQEDNAKEIDYNMRLAQKAKEQNVESQMLLSSRKAARLKESNEKYAVLENKMNILYRVLTKMYSNSEILLEDTKDQVKLKEEERKAIRASYSAMKSAMSIISGNADKRAMFDQALEVIADDVAMKVGEMERFMEMSTSFMDSVDLQNGVFEDQGMKMLEDWEKNSTLMLLGGKPEDKLDINAPRKEIEMRPKDSKSEYDNLFES